jgi:hypothetical protein
LPRAHAAGAPGTISNMGRPGSWRPLSWAPQGRYLALTRDAARDYHTIVVWNEEKRTLNAVISVQEVDPGSGSSHDYRWSADGKALLIYGAGSLPLHSEAIELSYAYLPDVDALYSLPPCTSGALGENAAQQ